ncbi:MAG: tRNA (N(6)-L-threonylcarbamoyladenosine(37)-C(2))-methylthiotransferase MtaB [Ignavibacteria bacterium]|nr:tRNA (N(6)-L-threonylcarbamoyladenosine(37)-C(2))-methylthiotransferase MtaB [Ignavibacteria bacterium]
MQETTTVSFHTLGCKLNYAESAQLQQQFTADGCSIVEFDSPADVVVVNTCTVTEQANTECRKIVRRALRTSPNAKVIVTGCYAQLKPEEILEIPGVSAVVGTADKMRISELLFAATPGSINSSQLELNGGNAVKPLSTSTRFTGATSADAETRTRTFFKLQDGCDYTCTFCTIPQARGPARAILFADIAPAMEKLALQGVPEVVLTGVNVGEYLGENGERFVDVVRLINSMQLPFRVRISSIEPNTLTKEVIDEVAASDVFVPHVHVPLQSGSAEILKNMRRRYNPQMYRNTVDMVHAAMPQAGFGIDVIVGFPGETDALFEETVQFLNSIQFSYLHVFTYSERDNTPAAAMSDVVPVHVRRERTRRLRAISDVARNRFALSNLGTIRNVIPEQFIARYNAWSGYTENYVKVLVPLPENSTLKNVDVELLSIEGEYVLCRVVE